MYPIEPSDELAYEYFRQASSATPDALAHLGYMHLKGRYVEQDNKTALEYFKLAAARVRVLLLFAASLGGQHFCLFV